jgi:hypothetical protein
MAINFLDAKTTQRLSVALLAAAGALTFNAFQLVAAGVSAGDRVYAAGISSALTPLELSLVAGLASFIFAELANDPRVPKGGGRWSKQNLLESTFVYLCVFGLGALIVGAYMLFSAAAVSAPSP